MKRSVGSFEIALSALACAAAAVALTVGSYVDFLMGAGYMIAVFALMIPLSKNFYWGSCFALIGAVLLAFLFCGLAFVPLFMFAAFFGWHPILNRLQKNFVKKKLLHGVCFLIKAVWFDCTLYAGFYLYSEFMGLSGMTWYPFVAQNLSLVVFLGGTLVFAVYDFLIFLCQRSVDGIVKRIGR